MNLCDIKYFNKMKTTYPNFSLNGKTALITGAARGLGKACALALANAGADIALGLRDISSAPQLEKEIKDMGRMVIPLQMDVSSMDQINKAIQTAEEHFGRIDILVNNVGGNFAIDVRITSAEHLRPYPDNRAILGRYGFREASARETLRLRLV